MSNAVKGTKEVQKLLAQMGKSANKILRKELRVTSKEVAADVKPSLPRDTGFLQRSVTVRAVKKKKRYSVAFRVVAKPPKDDQAYYAFAAEYGVAEGLPGHQPAHHAMAKGIDHAEAKLPAILKTIAQALETEWRKAK